jgi:hypothetical protein
VRGAGEDCQAVEGKFSLRFSDDWLALMTRLFYSVLFRPWRKSSPISGKFKRQFFKMQ